MVKNAACHQHKGRCSNRTNDTNQLGQTQHHGLTQSPQHLRGLLHEHQPRIVHPHNEANEAINPHRCHHRDDAHRYDLNPQAGIRRSTERKNNDLDRQDKVHHNRAANARFFIDLLLARVLRTLPVWHNVMDQLLDPFIGQVDTT